MTSISTESTLLFVSPEIEEMQHEIMRSPELMEKLRSANIQTFEDGLAIIADYCDVVLHGDYTGNDIRVLCGKLADRLRAKRGSIIIPPSI